MLRLLTPTDARWAPAAAADLKGLLIDHAHCELKAAQSALSLIARYGGEAPEIVEPLSKLAREETLHFREVHRRLASKETPLGIPRRDAYVGALWEAARSDHQHAPIFLDRLLVCALIEARSCERFIRLRDHYAADTQAPESADLAHFYEGLMEAEAKHFTLFSSLARGRFGGEADARLDELARREAQISSTLPLGPTIHG